MTPEEEKRLLALWKVECLRIKQELAPVLKKMADARRRAEVESRGNYIG